MKLALVVDKSESYLSFQRQHFLELWQVDPETILPVKSFEETGGTSLFGEASTALLRLETADDVKRLVAALAKETAEGLEERLTGGLIILTAVPRNSTKKLETMVTSFGGTVVAQAGGKDASPARDLIAPLMLSRECNAFLLDYAGEKYEMLIPLVTTIEENIPSAHRSRITVEDLQLRLAQAAGGIPAYEILTPLLKGDTKQVQEKYQRIITHSHMLVILAMVRNRFQGLYRVASLQGSGTTALPAMATALGMPNDYKFKKMAEEAKRVGLPKLSRAVTMIQETEAMLKGGSAAPAEPLFNAMLLQVSELIRSRA